MAREIKNMAKIKCITARDFELLQGIAKTGVTSRYDATKIIGLSEKRLKNLEKDSYIKSKSVLINGTNIVKVYSLNYKGKSYVKLNTDIYNFYRSNERQIDHDLKLSSIYYNLELEQRKAWTNESDLIANYKLNNPNKKLNTMVDATFLINDIKVAVEVITKNYTKEQLQEKYNIADEIGCKEVLKIEV